MNNKHSWIKSVGFGFEDGNILDDRRGIDFDFVAAFEEGEMVTFDEGLQQVEEQISEWRGFESKKEKNEKLKEVKSKLVKLKEDLNKMGILRGSDSWKCWVLWGVEYDVNLGIRTRDGENFVRVITETACCEE